MWRSLPWLILPCVLSGCAGPLEATRPSSGEGLTFSLCGSSTSSASSMLHAADSLSSGPSDPGGLPPQGELHLCLEAANTGSRPLIIDRSHLHLKTQAERQPWIPDADNEEVEVKPGQHRRFAVAFASSPLDPGQAVYVELDGAVKVGGGRASVPPLALRVAPKKAKTK
jgi:hypothetical protein